MTDGLYTFGTLETVEIPAAGPQAANDAVAKAPLGVLYRHKGNLYKYVQHDKGSGSVASVAGGVAQWKSLAPSSGTFVVTPDVTDGLGGANGQAVAGIYGGVVTHAFFTWVQVKGVATALTAASTAAGDGVTGSSTDLTFGRLQNGQAFTGICYGCALDARNTTAGTNTVLLQNLEF